MSPYKGFICVNHFNKDDLETKKQKISLKKHAIPTIFNGNENVQKNPLKNCASELNKLNHPNPPIPLNENHQKSQNPLCAVCDILKAENENLRQHYIELETRRCVEIATLENDKKKLKANSEIQKQHIKYLSGKLYVRDKSLKSLKSLLKDLQTQSLLTAEAYDALEVSISTF